MGQYFDNDETVKSDIKKIKHYFKDKIYEFYTDNGVFSKNGFDFGSNTLINSLELDENIELLDVGCGYGAMGIILSKHFNISVDMVDVNLRAIELTKKNIEINKVKRCNVFYSDIYKEVDKLYDVVITNPPIRAGKHIVHEIIKDAKTHLRLKGEVYVVIQKKQGAASAVKLMEDVYKNCETINSKKGYLILRSINE